MLHPIDHLDYFEIPIRPVILVVQVVDLLRHLLNLRFVVHLILLELNLLLLVEMSESLLLVAAVEETCKGCVESGDLGGHFCVSVFGGALAFAFALVVALVLEALVLGDLLGLQCFDVHSDYMSA